MQSKYLVTVLACLVLTLFTFSLSISFGLPARAQSTVGNGTTFLLQEGKSADYGINSNDIGRTQFGQELFSRHEKEGNSLGIGSSTLQTVEVTSESGKATIAPFSVSRTQTNAIAPSANMAAAIQGFSGSSPALNGVTVSPSTGLYSGIGLTPTYANFSSSSSLAPGGIYQDLNAVPSFSRGARLSLPPIGSESESDWVLKKGGPRY